MQPSTQQKMMQGIADARSVWARVKRVAVRSIDDWVDQRAASKGAALAFYTLFSMAPLLVLVIAIAGAVFGVDAAQGEIYRQLKGLIGSSGAEAIQSLVAHARNPASGGIATIIAILFLFVGATTVFSELKDSLDEIWQVPKPRQSGIVNLVRTRLLSFGLVLVLAFLLLISLVISAALAVLERFIGGFWAQAAFVFTPVASLMSFCIIACLFAVIYKMLPSIRLSWRDVWVGALGTAGLFTLGKYLIGAYLGNSAVANSYGAAGSVVAVLLWVYYSAQIFFLGAEFTRQYALWFGSLRSAPGPK
jgi:membrane protein